MPTIKAMVSELIDRDGLRYEQIAAAVGCTAQSVRNWHRGEVTIALPIYRDNLTALYRSTKLDKKEK